MARTKAQFLFSLCADDYALSPGVNRGILEALSAGRLTATSVLTTCPSWPLAAQALRECNAKADIGLHLNLTFGSPLAPMPSFARSGVFPGLDKIVKSALKRELPETEIGQEISRQMVKFFDHFGAAPDYVDGHHHVHILPQVRRQLFKSLEEMGLQGKLWLRNVADSLPRILQRNPLDFTKALGIAWLSKGFGKEAAMHGFITNDGFAGFSAFDPSQDYATDFARYLRAPGMRHLIMCHPGYCDEALAQVDSATISRERELHFLLSSAFTDMLDRNGAALTRLSACQEPH